MSDARPFPDAAGPVLSADDAGFDDEKLQAAAGWLERNSEGRPYRVAVLRRGHWVAEWRRGIDREAKHGIASGQKTLYGCMLAIAVAEGRIGSADDRVADTFPEMMDVPEGRGPKPGRHVTPEDREITFRQLITNTSGYLKPDERPGTHFHYQTFGMNLLTHAIEKVYGCYDPDAATGAGPSGFGRLVQEKIAGPIGVQFEYRIGNFAHPPEARVGIFGNSTGILGSLDDWARLGTLWLNGGAWNGVQVIPRAWLEAATRTADLVRACTPPEEWCYGYAFWCNDFDRRWPGLPRDSYSASGAGYNVVWVCPSLELIVIQNPGGGPTDAAATPSAREARSRDMLRRERELLTRIVAACR
jgi:CubicO group peptidase (beta-lactamase class C family)